MHCLKIFIPCFILILFMACRDSSAINISRKDKAAAIRTDKNIALHNSTKSIHVLVALCDNKYQGIVPVPAKIGNGQDPDNNLYWGCAFGLRSFFKNSLKWQLLKRYRLDDIKMERLVFKHKTSGTFLVADAYNGKNIKDCTIDFLKSCAGILKDTLRVNGISIGINGNAALISYIGHDGLMDFTLHESFQNADGNSRDAIILACYSKRFFAHQLSKTKARPLVWSTHLMSPEAYTLHDAIESYLQHQTPEAIRSAAAKAYARYQKCSERAARALLVSGY